MTRPLEDQSLSELLGSLASSIPNLVRDEFVLLRTQLAFALARVRAASALLVAATALAMGTIILLVAAAVSGLTTYLLWLGFEPATAVALAALAVAVVAALVAVVLVIAARSQLQRAQTAIEQSIDAVARNATAEEKTN